MVPRDGNVRSEERSDEDGRRQQPGAERERGERHQLSTGAAVRRG
ncbi:hypothetical protein [Phytohabitans suffuscus]|nr:hypothetical protein [Phytohabitans suffuscus]